MWPTCLLFLSLFLLVLTEEPKERPIVNTLLGKIRGYHKKSAKRNLFAAFEGIPYAKPPLEDLRFEPPEPINPWEGTWDATTVTECPQGSLTSPGSYQGDEDCLHLNVYTPEEYPKAGTKRPVIVHIHGGLFSYGSAHSYAHPEYFMDSDVIFVNFNYRIGVLGFLSTEDDVVKGNMGLKDQVLALKWVQDHIAAFGGNPDEVTITGLSSGGSSVHYHYLSDKSVGLFKRGFSQSGVALNSIALQEKPLQKAQELAEAVGCPKTSSSVLVECLKQRPFKHLLARVGMFHGFKFLPVAPFAPVLEKGSEPFLTKNPFYLMQTGKIQDLPWLVSTVAHEGLFPAALLKQDLDFIDQNFNQIASSLLDYKYSLSEAIWNSTAKEIREEYFKDEEINEDNFGKLVQMLSDRFLVDVDSAIKLQAKVNKSPVYYYNFEFAGESSVNNTVAHGEDGQYFFYNMYGRQPTVDELNVKDLMMNMLLTFAKTGKPVLGDQKWDPVEYPKINFLNVKSHTDIEKKTVDELGPKKFWQTLGFLENQNLVITKNEL